MMTRWGKLDSLSPENSDDRIELIEDSKEARAQFGENFGTFEFKLTREQIEGLLAGTPPKESFESFGVRS